MSTGPDTATIPVFVIKGFPYERNPPFKLTPIETANKFVAKNKLEPQAQFFLTDNEVRILSTLMKVDDAYFAVIHWATQEDVVV